MALITQREYAARKQVTPQYINKLVAQGKIRKVGNKIDSRQADAALKQTRERVLTRRTAADRARQAKASTSERRHRSAAAAKPKRAPSRVGTPLPKGSLTEARTDRERAQAELVKLDLEGRKGNLLPRAEVLAAERQKNANLKTALRRLPRNLASLLARMTSAPEIEIMLLGEVDLLLERLAADPLGSEDSAPEPMPPAGPAPTNSQE